MFRTSYPVAFEEKVSLHVCAISVMLYITKLRGIIELEYIVIPHHMDGHLDAVQSNKEEQVDLATDNSTFTCLSTVRSSIL